MTKFIKSFVLLTIAIFLIHIGYSPRSKTRPKNDEIKDTITWQELADGVANGNIDPRGYGLTVFKGTKIERFEVTFEGVVPHPIIPNEKMILVRMGHPLEGSNVLAGMSGSPVYFYKNGKPHLLGAIAFGWSAPSAGESLGGITPISAMLNQQTTFASQKISNSKQRKLEKEYLSLKESLLQKNDNSESGRQKLAELRKNLFENLSKPITIGTYNGFPIELLQPLFNLSAGLKNNSVEKNNQLAHPRPGDAVTMMLTDGELPIGGTCTVTYATENKFWACGHPILMEGDIVAPVKMAEIATSYKGPTEAMKMVSRQLEPAGYITYDGAFAIEGYVKKVPADAMIPVNLEINIGKNSPIKISYSVFRNNPYTGILIDQVAHATVESLWNIKRKAITKSVSEISFDETSVKLFDASNSGTTERFGPFIIEADPWSAVSKTAETVGYLMASDWQFQIKKVDIAIHLEYGEKILQLDALKITDKKGKVIDSASPGDTVYLVIALRNNQGTKKFVREIPMALPPKMDLKRNSFLDGPAIISFFVESGKYYSEKDERKTLNGKPENKEEFLNQLFLNERDPQKIYVQMILPTTKVESNKQKSIKQDSKDAWKEVKTLNFFHSIRNSEKKVFVKEFDSPLDDYIISVSGQATLNLNLADNATQQILLPFNLNNLNLPNLNILK